MYCFFKVNELVSILANNQFLNYPYWPACNKFELTEDYKENV